MLIDTGAANSFIHQSQLQHIRIHQRIECDPQFKLADGSTPFPTNGKVIFPLQFGHIVTYVHAFITNRLSCGRILGNDWITQYGVDIHTKESKIVVHTKNGSTEHEMDNGSRSVPIRLVGSICLIPGQEVVVDASASYLIHVLSPWSARTTSSTVARPLRLPDASRSHQITIARLSSCTTRGTQDTARLAPRTRCTRAYVDGDIAVTQPTESNRDRHGQSTYDRHRHSNVSRQIARRYLGVHRGTPRSTSRTTLRRGQALLGTLRQWRMTCSTWQRPLLPSPRWITPFARPDHPANRQ